MLFTDLSRYSHFISDDEFAASLGFACSEGGITFLIF